MDLLFLWISLVLTAFLNVVGDFHGKRWAENGSKTIWMIAAISYAVDQLFFAVSLTFGALATNIFIVFLMAAIADVAIGIAYFKEKLNRKNKVGIVLGFLGLILLNM